MKHLKSMSHRGNGSGFPENTLLSLQSAIDNGFEWVEFDLRQTKDKQIILFHDADFKGSLLSELTLDELNHLTEEEGFTVPTFEEALKLTSGRIKINAEFKEKAFDWEALGLALKYFKREDFIFSSFHYELIRQIKRMGQEIQLALIVGDKWLDGNLLVWLINNFSVLRAKNAGANIIVARERVVFFNLARRTRRHGMKLIVWTVNDKKRYNKLVKNSLITAVCTDIIPWK